MNKILLIAILFFSASAAQAVTCEDMSRVADFIQTKHASKFPEARLRNLVSQEKVGVYTRETYMRMIDTVYHSKGWPQNYGEATLHACLKASQ